MASTSQGKFPSLSRLVNEIIGPEGRIAKKWPSYEHRPGQLQMAEEVARAFADRDIALIEAGTGTGKTLAYLIPALLSGQKTVVSTGTKNLQEQIFHKDIPFIRSRLNSGFNAVYLKGRENYLCLHFYKIFLREPTFELAHEALFLDRLKEWVQETLTGDRAELTDLPEGFTAWSDLSAPGERCLGKNCPELDECFLMRARRAAAKADLVVVNHHLFMADLAVREGGFGEVIPDYDAVIFDEAHQLEDVATQYFGLAVSSWRLAALKRDGERVLTRLGKMNPGLARALVALGHQADALSGKFFSQNGEFELWDMDDPVTNRLFEFGRQVLGSLDNLAGRLEKAADKDEEVLGLERRAKNTCQDLAFILEADDSKFVYWAEKRGRGVFLRASPIDVAPFLQEALFNKGRSLVLTSATLTTEQRFDYYKERLGLLPEIEGIIVDSPFDLEHQSILYVPRPFPRPSDRDFLPALTTEIEHLLQLSDGRAFVLFTSYRNMHYVAEALRDRLPWPCLVQGEAPRTALLERFREETHSVLMATHSFWQGVDVPGESLSAVIIDKLPFPRPDDPLIRARSARLADQGQDPFMSYLVPGAIISLKQGLGRLIRTRNDYGLLAVLDSRLLTKGYGKKFLQSLPGRPPTRNPADVEAFFARFKKESAVAP